LRGRIGVSASVYLLAVVCAAFATQGSLGLRHHIQARELLSKQVPLTVARAQVSAGDFIGGRELDGRRLYPYSVIPGGVENAGELKDAVLRDPVVAAHYADFNIAQAHVVRLDADRAMYVSYRLGDRVFWTTKALKLHKGETLISDGAHEARTRCGNRLSETPVAPVAPEAPPADVLNVPEAPVLFTGSFPPSTGFPLTPPGVVPTGSPSTPPTGVIIPPPVFPIVGTGGGPTPPVEVPEPSAFVLLMAGLVTLLGVNVLFSIRKKRKA
jgi:hypothetical protein